MAAISNKPTLQIIRQLLSEIRRASSEPKIKDSLIVRYIMSQCQKYKTTDLQHCKAQEEVKHLATTYLCYLQSKRNYNKINTEYTGKGERSIEDTAKLVGFKLPHDPK